MKIRGHIDLESARPDRSRGLLAAFLEATGKIDRRALQRRGALTGDAPTAVNLEALPTLLEADPTLLQAEPTLPEPHPTLLEASPMLIESSPPLPEASLTSATPKSAVAPYVFRRANVVKP